jgi:murein DD-endopeptidase MepM/ murein hydrolase activator NlpD
VRKLVLVTVAVVAHAAVGVACELPAPEQPSAVTFSKPVPNEPGEGFGPHLHPILQQQRHHDGLDFPAPVGTPVVAVLGGRIVGASHKGALGNTVEIDHGNGLVTRYAHLARFSATTTVDACVVAGDVIAFVGNTGIAAGPHLHLEVLIGDKPVDPAPFLRRHAR